MILTLVFCLSVFYHDIPSESNKNLCNSELFLREKWIILPLCAFQQVYIRYCVSYKISENPDLSTLSYPVQYTDKRIDITRFVDHRAQLLTNLDRRSIPIDGVNSPVRSIALPMVYLVMVLSSLKHSSWSYEREFRCLASTRSPGMPYIYAKASEIYIGINCKKENVDWLYQIGEKLGVPVYQMRFDEMSPDYQLSKTPDKTTAK